MNPKNLEEKDLEIQHDGLSLLFEISKLLEDSDSLEEVLNPVLMILSDQLHLEDAAITIFDNKSKKTYIDASYGLSPQQRNRGQYRIGEGIIGEVVQTNKQIIVPLISKEPRFLGRAKTRISHTELSFICVPVRHKKKVTGTLSITMPFRSQEKLEELAKFITILSFLLLQPIILRRQLSLVQQEIEKRKDPNYQFYDSDINAIKGSSQIAKRLKQYAHSSAKQDAPLFIYGESGTGKTFIANLIHNIGLRNNNQLIHFTPTTYDAQALSSTLFDQAKPDETMSGILAKAHNTTLLIEHIEKIPLSVQQKLLHTIQSQELLIDTKIIPLSTRYMFSSHYSLSQLRSEKKIHTQLYEILLSNILRMPPLKERKEDIISLSDHFIQTIVENQNNIKKTKGSVLEHPRRLSTPAIELLLHYHWPGNINELYKTLEHAVYKSRGGVIYAHTFPPSLQSADSTNTHSQLGLAEAISRVEKDLIIDALKSTSGHMSNAAQTLKISDRILGLRIKKYRISPKNYK